MYDRVKARLPRTNNSVEGWHSGFAQDIHVHPSLERLVDRYHADQNRNRLSRTQQNMGRVTARTRRKYVAYDTRLIGLIDMFDRGVLDNLQFLKNIARIAKFNTD